jgi:ketosteroid isomerase-like protein
MKIETILFILVAWTVTACEADICHELNTNDEIQLRKMILEYNDAWLRNDSASILNLFADTAILIPSGLKPIKGKEEIIKFWWPNDSSKTIINSYNISLLEINGSANIAYTLEHGKLSWSYEKGDFKMSKDQQSYEITIFRKASNSHWKMVRRIWIDLKK